MKLAEYTKSARGQDTVFAVTPTSKPNLGCAGIFFFGLIALLVGLVSGGLVFGDAGDGRGFILGLGIAVLGFLKWDFRPKLHRRASTFTVSPDGITADGKTFARDDIHRLAVRNHYDRSQEIVLTGNHSAGVGAGADAKHIITKVTYYLQLESGGRAQVLAGGLDETTAFGLLTDVRRILGFNQP